MPALNKQTLVNLLIDSPLREPIKINLIDIVNNTNDADLPKVYPTITKELEIFQKATDRRLKLADETIKKLSSDTPPSSEAKIPSEAVGEVGQTTPSSQAEQPADPSALQVPPLDLPPLPAPSKVTDDVGPAPKPAEPTAELPQTPAPEPVLDTPTPLPPSPAANQPLPPSPAATPTTTAESADEAALKEIQKELDALKDDAAMDANPTPPPAAAAPTNPTPQPEV